MYSNFEEYRVLIIQLAYLIWHFLKREKKVSAFVLVLGIFIGFSAYSRVTFLQSSLYRLSYDYLFTFISLLFFICILIGYFGSINLSKIPVYKSQKKSKVVIIIWAIIVLVCWVKLIQSYGGILPYLFDSYNLVDSFEGNLVQYTFFLQLNHILFPIILFDDRLKFWKFRLIILLLLSFYPLVSVIFHFRRSVLIMYTIYYVLYRAKNNGNIIKAKLIWFLALLSIGAMILFPILRGTVYSTDKSIFEVINSTKKANTTMGDYGNGVYVTVASISEQKTSISIFGSVFKDLVPGKFIGKENKLRVLSFFGDPRRTVEDFNKMKIPSNEFIGGLPLLIHDFNIFFIIAGFLFGVFLRFLDFRVATLPGFFAVFIPVLVNGLIFSPHLIITTALKYCFLILTISNKYVKI